MSSMYSNNKQDLPTESQVILNVLVGIQDTLVTIEQQIVQLSADIENLKSESYQGHSFTPVHVTINNNGSDDRSYCPENPN